MTGFIIFLAGIGYGILILAAFFVLTRGEGRRPPDDIPDPPPPPPPWSKK